MCMCVMYVCYVYVCYVINCACLFINFAVLVDGEAGTVIF